MKTLRKDPGGGEGGRGRRAGGRWGVGGTPVSRVNCRGAVGGGNGWRRGRRLERPGCRDWPGVGRLEGDGAAGDRWGPGGRGLREVGRALDKSNCRFRGGCCVPGRAPLPPHSRCERGAADAVLHTLQLGKLRRGEAE